MHLPSEALNSSSIGKTQVSDSKGIASSNNNNNKKRALKGFLEISFYKIVFEQLGASQAETWIELLPLHTHSF